MKGNDTKQAAPAAEAKTIRIENKDKADFIIGGPPDKPDYVLARQSETSVPAAVWQSAKSRAHVASRVRDGRLVERR